MKSRDNEAAPSERARWLAELGSAIDRAQQLAWRLGYSEGDSAEARELYRRLERARVEVQALRRGGWDSAAIELCPKWIRSLLGLPD